MPRIIRLTWIASTRRWQKKYHGQTYYFPFSRSQYAEAFKAWERKKAEIDRLERLAALNDQEDELEALWNRWRANAMALIEASDLDTGTEKLAIAQRSLAVAAQIADTIQNHGPQSPPAKLFDFEPPLELDDAADLPARHRKVWKRAGIPAALEPKKSIGHNVDEYLAEKRREAEAGQGSLGTFRNICCRIRVFEKWIERETDASTITAKTLADYRGFLLKKFASPVTAKNDFAAVKVFVHWIFQRGILKELPRNFTDKSLSIRVPTQSVRVFPSAVLQEILEKAKGKVRLYLLLILNCGYLQADIAELKHDEIDWERGRITRKRSKTKGFENVPTVTYQLWAETFALLKEYRSQHAEFVIVNRYGLPLKRERLEGESLKTSDIVEKAFRDFKERNGITNKLPLKYLRKTAASLIANEPRFRGLETLYLGHSPRSIAGKYYTNIGDEMLDEALTWLGEKLGITSAKPKPR